MTWISLQPVAGAIENGYGYGATTISALGITYMIVFILVFYPANIVIEKGGLRVAVSIQNKCLILSVVGAGWTRIHRIGNDHQVPNQQELRLCHHWPGLRCYWLASTSYRSCKACHLLVRS